MGELKDINLNCTRCGSNNFRIIDKRIETPVLLSDPLKYRKTVKYTVRCAECDGYIGSMKMDDE